MHFLIDADSIIYKAGCANEERIWYVGNKEAGQVLAEFEYKSEATDFADGDETLDIWMEKYAGAVAHSLANVKIIMDKIVRHPRCSTFQVYISGDNNFRYDVDENYKGNRDPNAKPIHEHAIRNYLITHWGAEVVDYIEVDDEVSILAMENPALNVIVTIDKDLDNTAGWHYNYDKDKIYFVSDQEADHNFCLQLLTGDTTDNIKGCRGVGKVKASDILPYPLTYERMCAIVWQVYQEKGHDWDYFVRQGQLLWMLRYRNEEWLPPFEEEQDGEIEVRSGLEEEAEEVSV
jgi:DNA polymerase I